MGDMADFTIENGELEALGEIEDSIQVCSKCRGTGYVDTQKNLEDCSLENHSTYGICKTCNGEGRVI